MLHDQSLWLPDDVLMKADRASMLASLEVRTPFLQPRTGGFRRGGADRSAPARGREGLLRELLEKRFPGGGDDPRSPSECRPPTGCAARCMVWSASNSRRAGCMRTGTSSARRSSAALDRPRGRLRGPDSGAVVADGPRVLAGPDRERRCLSELRALVLTPDFPPEHGGIQTLVHRVVTGWTRLRPQVVAIADAGAEDYDATLASTRSGPAAHAWPTGPTWRCSMRRRWLRLAVSSPTSCWRRTWCARRRRR